MTADNPKVSVVMCVRNGETYLEEALRSVRDQDRSDLEIVFIDDGSTDGTARIAKEYGAGLRYYFQPNAGPSASRNRGLELAKGEYVTFLDGDDVWGAGWIREALRLFGEHPQAMIVMGRIELFRSTGTFAYPFTGFYLGSALIRRELFRILGPFDTTRRMNEDFDWFLRAREKGIDFAFADRTALYYRRHEKNYSRSEPSFNFSFLEVLKLSLDRRRLSSRDKAAELEPLRPPRVSVILPVKNGEKFIARALQSVFSQSVRPFEVIVVNSHSTDQTAEIARSFEGVALMNQEDSDGLPGALNLGLKISKGDFVAFLDHDDRWAVGKLKVQLDAFKETPDLLCCLGRVQYQLEEGSSVPPGFKTELLSGDWPARLAGALLARRAAFEKVGAFDTRHRIACDVDWFIRAEEMKIKTASVPEVILYKSVHGSNLSNDAGKNNEELMRILRESVERRKKAP
jgi:glycosyltransferase involved in cell wall biosynthesis